MSAELKNDIKDINSYYIAFSSGAKADKLKKIAIKSSGTFYEAISGTAIDVVYDAVADKIANNVSITNVEFSEKLPANVTIENIDDNMNIDDNNIISKNMGSISFYLTETDTEYTYTADPYTFSISVKLGAPGEYIFGANNTSTIHYTNLNGDTVHKFFAPSTLTVNDAVPTIETEYVNTLVITEGIENFGRPIHVKTDGGGSEIVATYMKKLEDQTTADASDFIGDNSESNELLLAYGADSEIVTPFTLSNDKPEEYKDFGNYIVSQKTEYFLVSENGYYAIYTINESGNETVEIVFINSIIKKLPDNI